MISDINILIVVQRTTKKSTSVHYLSENNSFYNLRFSQIKLERWWDNCNSQLCAILCISLGGHQATLVNLCLVKVIFKRNVNTACLRKWISIWIKGKEVFIWEGEIYNCLFFFFFWGTSKMVLGAASAEEAWGNLSSALLARAEFNLSDSLLEHVETFVSPMG